MTGIVDLSRRAVFALLALLVIAAVALLTAGSPGRHSTAGQTWNGQTWNGQTWNGQTWN